MKLTIEHIGLAANDPDALRAWCQNALGAELVYSDGKIPPAFFLRLPGGVLIEIYAADSKLEQTGHNQLAGWRHLALRVDSIAAARAWLTERGVALEAETKPAGGGGQVLFFRDVEGNLWHLVERPPGSILS